MSKLDKDQLDKISGGVSDVEKTENFRVDGEPDTVREVGVYWDETNKDIAGGDDPSIGPNNG